MLQKEWEQAVVRAALERSFCARLLADPADALSDYGLGSDAASLVASLRASSLPEFVGNVLRMGERLWGRERPLPPA